MLKIIALKGVAGRGKTSTLKELAKLLGVADTNKSEINTCINVKIKGDDIKVAIVSQGDPGTNLKKRLQDKVEKGCDVIICATRTSGSTVNAVNSMAPSQDQIVWTSTYTSMQGDKPLQAKMNKLMARHLKELLFSLVE